jgi:hypothetical protein
VSPYPWAVFQRQEIGLLWTLRAILAGTVGPFLFTSAAVLVLKGLSHLGGDLFVGLLMPFCVVLSTAAGLKLLTPALPRLQIVLSVIYFLAMLGLQLWHTLLLWGHIFGEWL